ncbi:hypothetical protein BDK51DRAFT_32986 [Blyttiomyces helicus]|uniref:PH domain-containing protein n=1 Tax=Blyttiomyces helicus TaxID=388810 RepID=A0A4P9WM29_9FUNG|nr:hypothetical protein BDK51DRAFT_32986 [Blyttiomyces helicus]|eukprot:RKO91756.1 hypothetical protein BDK51DRAFT_32986 [Blyttiomyces helicus]
MLPLKPPPLLPHKQHQHQQVSPNHKHAHDSELRNTLRRARSADSVFTLSAYFVRENDDDDGLELVEDDDEDEPLSKVAAALRQFPPFVLNPLWGDDDSTHKDTSPSPSSSAATPRSSHTLRHPHLSVLCSTLDEVRGITRKGQTQVERRWSRDTGLGSSIHSRSPEPAADESPQKELTAKLLASLDGYMEKIGEELAELQELELLLQGETAVGDAAAVAVAAEGSWVSAAADARPSPTTPDSPQGSDILPPSPPASPQKMRKVTSADTISTQSTTKAQNRLSSPPPNLALPDIPNVPSPSESSIVSSTGIVSPPSPSSPPVPIREIPAELKRLSRHLSLGASPKALRLLGVAEDTPMDEMPDMASPKAQRILGMSKDDVRRHSTTISRNRSTIVIPRSASPIPELPASTLVPVASLGAASVSTRPSMHVESALPLSGWVQKHSGRKIFRPWKARYCVLSDDSLKIYKSPAGTTAAPTSTFRVGSHMSIRLSTAPQFRGKPVLELRSGDRFVNLLFADAAEADNWLLEIKKAVARSRFASAALPEPPSRATVAPAPIVPSSAASPTAFPRKSPVDRPVVPRHSLPITLPPSLAPLSLALPPRSIPSPKYPTPPRSPTTRAPFAITFDRRASVSSFSTVTSVATSTSTTTAMSAHERYGITSSKSTPSPIDSAIAMLTRMEVEERRRSVRSESGAPSPLARKRMSFGSVEGERRRVSVMSDLGEWRAAEVALSAGGGIAALEAPVLPPPHMMPGLQEARSD